jgi:hypothetical protein
MLLSTQSFADLQGKGLLCKSIKSGKLYGYSFFKDFYYVVRSTDFGNDKFKLYTSPLSKYSLEPEYIITGGGLFINRKTLNLEGSSGKIFSKCELYDSKKLKARIEKQTKELQEKYDEKQAKENKI